MDSQLEQLVTKNVAKTVQMMAVKAEQLIISDGNASQVINPPTQAQRTNAAVFNLLHQFERNLRRVLSTIAGLSEDSSAVLIDSLKHLNTLMRNSLQPLFSSLTDAVEAILLTVHDEDFSYSQAPEKGSPCSLYMKELQNFMSRSATDYLPLYQATDIFREEYIKICFSFLCILLSHYW